MPFNYLLTNLLVDVPTAVGAIFLDDEGETVDFVTRFDDTYGLKVEGAYHSIFKRLVEEALQTLPFGHLMSYSVVNEDLVALTHLLPGGYYVVLVLERTGSQAQALYHLRRTASILARELA